MDRGRLEAFSDGVIAVAITLLALNLVVAGPGHGSLVRQLTDHWPAFVAYLISFFTIGIIWVNHHELLKNIIVINRTLLFLNLVLLLFVVLIPFGTSTMADYLVAGGQDSHVAAAVYAAIFEGMSLGFAAIFSWTLGEGRTANPLPRGAHLAAWLRFAFGLFAYLVAFGLAFVNAEASLFLIGLVAIYYIYEQTSGSARQAGADTKGE